MDTIWTVLLMLAVAVPVFLLMRWLATRRAIQAAERRRQEGQGGR